MVQIRRFFVVLVLIALAFSVHAQTTQTLTRLPMPLKKLAPPSKPKTPMWTSCLILAVAPPLPPN
jgi:hypothetical protein